MSEWKEDASKRRDFRQSRGGPEVAKHKSKKKKCKFTKEDHKYKLIKIVAWPFWKEPTENMYTYKCGCGKTIWTWKRLEDD